MLRVRLEVVVMAVAIGGSGGSGRVFSLLDECDLRTAADGMRCDAEWIVTAVILAFA
jgi:hypothetical protein